MKKIILSAFIFCAGIMLLAHPWKPNHYVIIDTDGGIDDMKAICLMLASPDVRVLAITVSPGALSADNAYIKVKSILNSFYHEGIPVGINRNSAFKSPEFRAAMDYRWGNEPGIDPQKATDFIRVIGNIFAHEKSKISFICLGSMNTAAESLKKIPEFRVNVKQIIWSCAGLSDTKGFNYSADPVSAGKMLSQDIPVRAIVASEETLLIDQNLISLTENINTPYAKKIYSFMTSETARGHAFSGKAVDELIPVYLHYPDMFATRMTADNSESQPVNNPGIRDAFVKILKGETVTKNQVLKEFPLTTSAYFDDLAPYVSEIIARYGENEWISGVIANELHRHLGVFAIIGVKMGIRAREYFNTGVDEFSATSHAGSAPPLSCMNDGIQVSTGATPGHGLLTVRNDQPSSPSVEFSYMERSIRLTLKPEIAKKISDELKEINYVYGLDSNIYWELVRKNSIRYWRELDRHEIFDITTIL
jgi:pyrimidine-specific ribonucleoside hydrolase